MRAAAESRRCALSESRQATTLSISTAKRAEVGFFPIAFAVTATESGRV